MIAMKIGIAGQHSYAAHLLAGSHAAAAHDAKAVIAIEERLS
jgi:hypothetical protein